jgi:hypothetical protein
MARQLIGSRRLARLVDGRRDFGVRASRRILRRRFGRCSRLDRRIF